jgi:hypothetical protein
MNLSIFLKVLTALSVVTDNNIAALAISLKQSLEMTANADPANVTQLNQIIAGAVCQDWTTFQEVAGFAMACLTQGQKANIPHALQQCERIALETTH